MELNHILAPEEVDGYVSSSSFFSTSGLGMRRFFFSFLFDEAMRRELGQLVEEHGGHVVPTAGDPACYHVLPCFTHPHPQAELEHWQRQGLCIIGLPCLTEAAAGLYPLPELDRLRRSPRYSNVMESINISFIGLPPDTEKTLVQLALFMGAQCNSAPEMSSHMIVGRSDAKETKDSIGNGRPILVDADWLRQCWEKQEVLPVDQFPVVPFLGLNICVLGVNEENRKLISSSTRELGGQFSESVSKSCTHLIVGALLSEEERKVVVQHEGSLKLVNPSWFFHSVERKVCMDEGSYPVRELNIVKSHESRAESTQSRPTAKETSAPARIANRKRSRSLHSSDTDVLARNRRMSGSPESKLKRRRSEIKHNSGTWSSPSLSVRDIPLPVVGDVNGLHTFKVYFESGDIRRFTIRIPRRWADFKQFLADLYPHVFTSLAPEMELSIRYIDEHGDPCIISSQLEWDALLLNPIIMRSIIRLRISQVIVLCRIKEEPQDSDYVTLSSLVKEEPDALPGLMQYGSMSLPNDDEEKHIDEEEEAYYDETDEEEEEEEEVEEPGEESQGQVFAYHYHKKYKPPARPKRGAKADKDGEESKLNHAQKDGNQGWLSRIWSFFSGTPDSGQQQAPSSPLLVEPVLHPSDEQPRRKRLKRSKSSTEPQSKKRRAEAS